jgi:uncharacterized membrane protein YkgB
MKNYKNLLKVSGTLIATGLLAFLYNFFNMYTLAGKCPNNVDVQPCQANDSWALVNKIGFVILIVGVAVLAAGLVKHHRNKS